MRIGVAGLENQNAEAYAEDWRRYSVGLNWLIHGHDIKAQLTYRIGKNIEGIDENDGDEIFVQGQYVF